MRKHRPSVDEEAAKRAYRERAKTAALVTTEREPETTILTAVYWTGDGLGGVERESSMEAALQTARRTMAMGYGFDPKYNTVQIIKRTVQVIDVSLEEDDA